MAVGSMGHYCMHPPASVPGNFTHAVVFLAKQLYAFLL
jgi:hypothetical protein